jgi:3-oxoacyl-[acyl-carrier protein] reductase
MELNLDGRNALVCGASRGIGRAAAQALAEAGARVFLVARDAERLKDTLATLAGTDGRGHCVLAADLGDAGALTSLADRLAAGPPLHIVVNNSGGPPGGPAITAEPAEFESAFRQHLVASQTIVQAVLDGMKASRYGRIINIISTSVKEPIPNLGVSNTIRGAVASWAKTLARELAPFGITVNNVLPGFTATERLDYLFSQRAQASGRSIDEERAAAMALVPAGRFAQPQETAAAVVFLASTHAAYINGINLPVDGGRTSCL